MKKKLLFSAFLLAITTLLPLKSQAYYFSAVAPSGQTLYYNIVDGTAQVTSQNTSSPYYTTYPTGDLTIPSTVTRNGTTYPVTSIGSIAFFNCTGLTSVTIPNSVTSIGYIAFDNCTGLTSVTIPNSVTSIGNNAFYNCTGLTSVTIPNSVTSIGEDAFDNCTGLTSLTIPNSVTSIGKYAFRNCTGLTTVNFIATNCTTMGSSMGSSSYPVFYGCTSLTTLNIGDNVQTIPDYAFQSCTGLTSVTIPNSVTSIGKYAFSGCTGLTTLNFNATNCTTMGSSSYPVFSGCPSLTTLNIGDNVQTIPAYAFYGCTGLTSVTIPNSVTSIGGYAFRGCSGLTSVTIPNSVTSISDYAFQSCTGLTSVTIPNSVTSIGDHAFYGCSGLTYITIGNSVTSIGNDAFYNCTGLTSVTIPNSVTSIGDYAFSGCSGLTSVTIGNSVTSIGKSAFRDCTGLTSVTIPNSVTSIVQGAFSGCTGLCNLDVPSSVTAIGSSAFSSVKNVSYNGSATGSPWGANTVNGYIEGSLVYADASKTTLTGCCTSIEGAVTIPNSVTTIGDYAFYNCTGLTSVTIPNSVTTIGNSAFCNCTGLTGTLTIPNSVTTIGEGVFARCTGLTSVTIPNSVTTIGGGVFYLCTGLTSVTIPNSVTSIGGYAFSGCSGLTSVTIGNSVTSIGEDAFSGCSGLTSLTIPNSVTTIGAEAFRGCTSLTSLTIPNSVTSISQRAFFDCTGLTSVTIGNSVTSIGDEAFSGCTGLTSITIPNSVTSIGNYAFEYCIGLCNLYVPSSVTAIGLWAFEFVKNVSYNGSATGSPWGANTVNGYIEGSLIYADTTKTTLTGCCTSIEGAVTIPNSVDTIGRNAFYGCTGLTSVTIPNSVTTIDFFAFEYCTGLTSVTIPNSVTSIGEDAFSRCTGLTTVNFNATRCTLMDYYNDDGIRSFRGCTSLSILNIGDNVQKIPDYAFYRCSGLTSLTIPNSVTSIGKSAFYECTGLTSVTIGNSVTSIGDDAFYNCTGINEIHSLAYVAPTLGFNVFDSVTSTIPVYIPCGTSGYGGRWNYYFSNFIEDEAFTFSAVSADNNMGTVRIFTMPTCTSPEAYIYASANSGYRFDHWSDNNTANPRSLTVTEDTELLAYFVPAGSQPTTYYTITAVSADSSMGFVSGGGSYAANSTASLTASPYSGYHFTRWHDNNTSNPRSITVTTNATYTAFFESDGGDQPSDNAPSIACVGVDMTNHNVVRWEPRQGTSPVRYNIYREGLGGYSQVGYVNATNATEYSWVDDNSNTATQAYSYKISKVSANGTESDLSMPHTTIHLQINQGQGTTWNLSWTPYVGFNYIGYRIYRGTTASSMSLLTELSSSATTYSDNNAPSGDVYYQIEVVASNGAKSIAASSRSNIATSVQSQQFTLTVLSDNTSMGTVTGGGTFAQGATTTISATALDGYHFTQWSDGSTQAQRTITVTGNATYTAYFTAGSSEPQQYLITVAANNHDRGTVSGGGFYDAGAIITITAEPFAGFEFVQWQDGNTSDFRTITVTADATYTAYFRTATQGINNVETADGMKIYTRGNTIVIDFSGQHAAYSRQDIVVYDVMGRVIKQSANSGQQAAVEIPVTGAGVYMVKVGEHPSRKVVVR